MTNEEGIKILKDCELNPCVPSDKEAVNVAIKALEHQKVGKWKKIKAIQYFVGGYSCSICQTVEEQPLEYCNCCGARMEVENDTRTTNRSI